MDKINQRIAAELGVGIGQVAAAVELLDEGATVPFIARYRKEATGGLDDMQLRELEERLGYLRELEDRRAAVLKSIEEQGKLTPELRARDRRRADQGRAGRPLPALQAQAPHQGADRARGRHRAAGRRAARRTRRWTRQTEAAKFVDADKGVADAKAVLDGARDILIERWARTPRWSAAARMAVGRGHASSRRCMKGKDRRDVAKFSDYFDFDEPIGACPRTARWPCCAAATRASSTLDLDVAHEDGKPHPAEGKIKVAFDMADARPAGRRLLRRDRAAGLEGEARPVAEARPAGAPARSAPTPRRSRCSPRTCATCCWPRRPARASPWGSIPASAPASRWRWSTPPARCWRRPPSTRTSPSATGRARSPRSAALCLRHKVDLISVGNGTASRETDKLAAELIAKMPELKLTKRGGVGGRRLGLFGLRVRRARNSRPRRQPARRRVASRAACRIRWPSWSRSIPRRIGVGQYQHDVDQSELARSLRCGGGGLRQLGRRRRQHGVRAAAGARVGPQRRRWPPTSSPSATRTAPSRRAPRSEGAAPRPQDLRAGGGLPAHHGRQEPARCLGRASRKPIRWSRRSPRPPSARSSRLIGDTRVPAAPSSPPQFADETVRRRRPSRTSWPSWRSPAAIRAPNSRPPPSTRAWRRSRT